MYFYKMSFYKISLKFYKFLRNYFLFIEFGKNLLGRPARRVAEIKFNTQA